jgi:hypothetical protein
MMPMTDDDESREYISDGLYAEVRGDDVLRLSAKDGTTVLVEPDAWDALLEYLGRVGWP